MNFMNFGPEKLVKVFPGDAKHERYPDEILQ